MGDTVLPWVHAKDMSQFLARVAHGHADNFDLKILDQAGWRLAGEWAVPDNTRLLFLPPHSPALNPA